MKSLREHLRPIMEATEKLVAFWDHFNPDDMCIAKLSPEKYKKLENYDYNIKDIDKKASRGLVMIHWNDEYCGIESFGVNNESSLKSAFKKELDKLYKDYNVQPGIVNEEPYDLCDAEFYVGDAYIPGNICYRELGNNQYEILDADKAFEHFKEFCKNSFVDGDSNEAWQIVDMDHQKVLYGPYNISFMDDSDWDDWFGEE